MGSIHPTEKSFLAGEIIIVDPNKKPKSGDFVIVNTTNKEESIFKQYIKDGPKKYLKPLNTQYPTLKLTHQMKITGIVVGQLDYQF